MPTSHSPQRQRQHQHQHQHRSIVLNRSLEPRLNSQKQIAPTRVLKALHLSSRRKDLQVIQIQNSHPPRSPCATLSNLQSLRWPFCVWIWPSSAPESTADSYPNLDRVTTKERAGGEKEEVRLLFYFRTTFFRSCEYFLPRLRSTTGLSLLLIIL